MLLSIAFTLSAALLAKAQNTANNTASTDTRIGIEAIEAHFTNAQIVPSLLKTFSPDAIMNLSYTGLGEVQPGQNLTIEQVKPMPQISLTPANSSVSFSGNYTLAMVDADVVGTDENKGQTRHWLVNDVTMSGNTLAFDHAVIITAYAGPQPPKGSGPHRYVVLLFRQPASFAPQGDLAQPNQPVGIFDVNQYANTTGLQSIVAATYFDVEDGTATASISATSPVITSTLAAAASATSGNALSSSPTPSSSGKNGAPAAYKLNVGLASVSALVIFFLTT